MTTPTPKEQVRQLPSNTPLKVTGYDPTAWFLASRYKQGGRTVFAIEFSVEEIISFLPKPDANTPLDPNAAQRKIYPAHARGFADYILENEEWVSPALLLRGPAIFKWEPLDLDLSIETVQFGQMGVPKNAHAEIKIVDGQHRTLGFHLAWEDLIARIEKARHTLAVAKKAGQPIVINDAAKDVDRLLEKRDVLARQRVSVQIVVIDDVNDARRIFVDINDNAKGITGSVKARFDDRKVLTRALNLVLEESGFLDGLVDLEQDRATGKSPYLLGAKHVSDMLRAITVGHGRIGRTLEKTLDERAMAKEFDAFLDALIEAFPLLTSLENGDIDAAELRAESLVGSNVMLRAFAAAWFELKQAGWTSAEIEAAFVTFEPHMGPVFADPDDTWFKTGVFQPVDGKSTTSPTSRAQDFRTLTSFIVDACKNPPTWHRAASAA